MAYIDQRKSCYICREVEFYKTPEEGYRFGQIVHDVTVKRYGRRGKLASDYQAFIIVCDDCKNLLLSAHFKDAFDNLSVLCEQYSNIPAVDVDRDDSIQLYCNIINTWANDIIKQARNRYDTRYSIDNAISSVVKSVLVSIYAVGLGIGLVSVCKRLLV